MSIQFSGGPIVSTTFSGSPASDARDAINAALVAAGWSSAVVAGGFDCTSATTPQGITVVAQLRSPANFQVGLATVGASFVGQPSDIISAAVPYQIICNPYQLAIFRPGLVGDDSGSRFEFLGGAPFIPAFLTGITEAFFSVGVFRSSLAPTVGIWASSIWNALTGTGAGVGQPRLVWPVGTKQDSTSSIITSWYDGSRVTCDPLIGYGDNQATALRARGVMWDAAIILGSYTLDLTDTFEGHDWQNMTNSAAAGSLWLATS